MKAVSRLWLAALASLLVATSGCSDTHDSGGSANVLERLRQSTHIADAERTVCVERVARMSPAKRRPALVATARAKFSDVRDAMKDKYGTDGLRTVPDLADDADVTLCLLDTTGIPAHPPVRRVVLANSGDTEWWADGQLR